jgi:hypothetical protein
VTKQTFYREVAKCHGTWELVRGAIRFYACQASFCPITAVLYEKTGERLATYKFVEAAQKLGLTQKDAYCIMAAADGYKEGGDFGEMCVFVGSRALKNTRRALLTATNLEDRISD